MIFIGSEYSGKTSLSNKLSGDLLKLGYGIIKLNGSEVKEVDALELFDKQSKKGNFFFEEFHNSKKALLIDDIQNLKFNDKFLEVFIKSTTDYFDKVVFFCDESEYFANSIYEEYSKLEGYRIQDLGYRKRDDLYSKWLSVGNPDIQTIDNNSYHEILDNLSNQVDSVISNNVVDSKPIFILTILQTSENFSAHNYSMTSLGECYSVLLHSLLSKQIRYDQYDSVISFLSFISYKLFNLDKDYFSDNEFDEWLESYNSTYIAIDNIKDILIKSHIIYTYSIEYYKFNQQYIFYYCAAKYIADNYKDTKLIVEDICQNLNNEKKANVLIFLVHHARNSDLVDSIILYSTELLSDLNEFDALKNKDFFQKFLTDINHNHKVDSVRKKRLDILKSKDILYEKKQSIDELQFTATHNMETHVSEDEAIGQQLKLLHEASSALRSIEVIGQVVKNRYGSLPTDKIEYSIEQCNILGFKIVQFFVDSIILTENDLIELIANLIENNEDLTKSDAEEKAKKYVRVMAFNLSYYIVQLVAKSISQKQIETLINKTCKKETHKLVNLAVKLKLHPKSLPKEYIASILSTTDSMFFKKLICQIVHNHLFLYELSYKDLQWASDKLGINVKTAHFTKKTKMVGKSTDSKSLLSFEDFRKTSL